MDRRDTDSGAGRPSTRELRSPGPGRAGEPAADRAARAFLGALADLARAGGRARWATDLAGILGGRRSRMATRGERALRDRAGPAVAALAAAGPPAGPAALGALCDTGLLWDYLAAAGPARAPGEATRAATTTGQAGARRAGLAMLADARRYGPEWAPTWAAVLGAQGGGRADFPRAELWGHLLACAGTASAARAPLADPDLGDAPRDRAETSPTLAAGLLALPPGERQAALIARYRTPGRAPGETRPGNPWLGEGARGGKWDGLAWALAASLPPRALRGLALRRAAGHPDPGTAPREDAPQLWEALLPERPGGGRTVSGASLLRCARWLAARPGPPRLAALELASGGGEEALPTLRALAGRGLREAAWALAARGDAGDEDAVYGALAGLADAATVGQAARLLARRGATGAMRGAIRAVLAGARDPRIAVLALAGLGTALVADAAPLAAMLLAGGHDRGTGARFLVGHAPELATLEALAAAGLFPGLAPGPGGTLLAGDPARGIATLRRRPDGRLARIPGTGTGAGDAGPALEADEALQAAWIAALGGPGEG